MSIQVTILLFTISNGVVIIAITSLLIDIASLLNPAPGNHVGICLTKTVAVSGSTDKRHLAVRTCGYDIDHYGTSSTILRRPVRCYVRQSHVLVIDRGDRMSVGDFQNYGTCISIRRH